jgi:hypothetical protein
MHWSCNELKNQKPARAFMAALQGANGTPSAIRMFAPHTCL